MKVVEWEGGMPKCEHERLVDVPVSTDTVLYSKPYTDRNGKFIESTAHVAKITTVRCLDCGALGKIL